MTLRRGVVTVIDEPGPPLRVRVDIAGEERPAISYAPADVGDDVVVNTAAVDLGLGSGGFDIVHVNLTRGLDQPGAEGAHVMKLNYTSLQHPVIPVEAPTAASGPPEGPSGSARLGKPWPVAILALHGQLAPVAWQTARCLADRGGPAPRIGFIQTWGGALPHLSRAVETLKARGLLAGHITAGHAHGGEHEAMTTIGAIHAAFTMLGWEAAIVGPGPGIIGSESPLGHGGMAALESAHAALALGLKPLIVPRMSSGDPRERHRGLSHHTRIVLELLLEPVHVALPEHQALPGKHQGVGAAVDPHLYGESGLPATTMGRGIDQDELFFRAALAGGAVLGEEIDVVRAGGK